MSIEQVADILNADIEEWYEHQRQDDNTVNRNVMAVGLIMCEHMRECYPLDEDKWFTGTQVRLLGRARIKKILARHGEERPFASEAGRTSRGSQDLARMFEVTVNDSSARTMFEKLSQDDRDEVIDVLQAKMVGRTQADFYDRQRIRLEVDFSKHTRHVIDGVLAAARDKGGNAVGAVAQHLIGAKLEIRHTDLEIERDSYTTADEQTGRPADFTVNDTAIHVTVTPTEALLDRCRLNIASGLRPMILTSGNRVGTAQGLASNVGIEDSVTVRGVEEFVSGNVDEIAGYSRSCIHWVIKQLFDTYNSRVSDAETDLSLLIDIPDNLAQ